MLAASGVQTRQNYDLCEGCRGLNEAEAYGPYEEIAPSSKVRRQNWRRSHAVAGHVLLPCCVHSSVLFEFAGAFAPSLDNIPQYLQFQGQD